MIEVSPMEAVIVRLLDEYTGDPAVVRELLKVYPNMDVEEAQAQVDKVRYIYDY